MTLAGAEDTVTTAVVHWFAAAAERSRPYRLGPATGVCPGAIEVFDLPLPDSVSELIEEIGGDRPHETIVLLLAAVAVVLGRSAVDGQCAVEADCAEGLIPVALCCSASATPRSLVEQLDAALVAALDAAPGLALLAAPVRERLSSDVLVGLGPRVGERLARQPLAATSLELRLDLDGGRLRAAFDAAEHRPDEVRRLLERCAQALAALGDADRAFGCDDCPADEAGEPFADRTLLDAFIDVAKARPEACAVSLEGRDVSYGELHARAQRFARRVLRRAPDRREAFVAVCLPKSEQAIVAFLGTLMSGAAYAPLDPQLPRARLQAMIEALRPAALVISMDQLLEFSWYDGQIIVLELDDATDSEPAEGGVRAAPACAAYAIFTSGSTGAPKPVVVEHWAIVNYVDWKQRYYGLGPDTVTLQVAPLYFDSAVSDLFSTLSCGGTLVLVKPQVATDPQAFAELLLASGATILAIVPSLYGGLLEFLPQAPALRTVTVAGEKVHASLARRHFARFPGVRLVNEYGPTEATVCATALTLAPADGTGDPSIGAAIDGACIHLLDGLDPIGSGAVGEICIGGAGLARGYAGDPAATAARFIAHPFRAGERLYRTGDLGRIRSDGLIGYAGRLDGQVKIRGHRVELGEIEAALLGHPAVREACAVAHGQGADAEVLAYVVSRGGEAPPDLIDHLRRWLPEPMLPAHIFALEALPLKRNGKLDRDALPVPAPASDAAVGLDPWETRIAAIWEAVLGRRPDTPEADFLDLGGHSLKAIQLLSRLIAEFGVELALRDIFACPTLASQARLLRDREGAGRAEAIPRIADDSSFALSPAQRSLWLAAALGRAPAAHHIPERLVIDGAFDLAAFSGALADLAQRHETFRMSFHEIGAEPRCRIAEHAALEPCYVDLSADADAEARAGRIAAEVEARVFDLERAPLARVYVVRLRGDRHVIFLTLHHLIVDGWSMRIVLRDLRELYESRIEGRPARLPTNPIRYRDYAAWRNERADGEDGERCRDYWRGALARLPHEPLLPRPQTPSVQPQAPAALRELALPDDLSAALLGLARNAGVPPFPLLLTLLAGALHRMGGQRDMLVGTVVSDRTRPELENLAGLFLDTLPLRIVLAPGARFDDAVGQTNRVLREAMAHQAASLDALLAARGGEDAHPFEVIATYEEVGEPPDRGRFQSAEHLDLATPAPELPAKFALAVLFACETGRLSLTVQHDCALVTTDTVTRLEALFVELAHEVVGDPRTVLTLAPTSLVGATARPADGVSVSARFERIAAARPDGLAVFGPQMLTYGEVDRWANAIGRALADAGLASEGRCAVLAPRSAAAAVAALGVMKAGGALLPISPEAPDRRIAAMLARAGCATILVADDESAQRARRLAETTIDIRSLTPAEHGPVGRAPLPDQLCYVVFTSGSTGEPKGVAVEHRAAVNLCDWWSETFALGPGSRGAVCSSVGFDAFLLETLPVWLSGGSLVFYADDEREPASLVERFAGDGVSHAFLTTALFDLLHEAEAPRARWTTRLATGGDALNLPAALRMPVINLYGPTEATVVATSQALACGHPPGPAPIGRPIDNTHIHILDCELAPLPAGTVGQIAIGGVSVARGYIAEPRETAAAFAPDPFIPGGRMFLTGDVGRISPDGALEFLGRRDEQVKIRGYRVEPREVEQVLRAHPLVVQAAVVVGGDGAARSLRAFVTSAEATLDTVEVLGFLRERLPEFMSPRSIRRLDALPLNRSGKLDRSALAALGDDEASTLGADQGDEAAALVTALWADVLGAVDTGADDDFFALGGDSLRAMRLTAAVRTGLGAPLALRLLFDHPRLGDYRAAVTALARTARAGELPPIAAAHNGATYPLTRAQETLYRQAEAAPGLRLFALDLTLRVSGPSSLAQVEAAIDAVTARHVALRTVFGRDDAGDPVGRIVTNRPWQQAADLTDLPQAEQVDAVTAQLNAFLAAPLPVGGAPPVRWLALALEPEVLILSLRTHHLVLDGWSADNLVDELELLLSTPDAALRLAPAPDFAAFATWQKHGLASGTFDPQREFWRGRLSRLPPPRQGDGPDWVAPRATASLRWPPELARGLADGARKRRCTRFMIVIAALAEAIAGADRPGSVSIGINVAGRPDGMERAIGLFANTVVIRLEADGRRPPPDVLDEARRTVIDALFNADAPFEVVLEDVAAATGGDARNLLQHMLLYRQAAPSRPARPVNVEPLDFGTGENAAVLAAAPFVFAADETDSDAFATSVSYRTDACDGAGAAALLTAWREAVERLAGASSQRLGQPSDPAASRAQRVERVVD